MACCCALAVPSPAATALYVDFLFCFFPLANFSPCPKQSGDTALLSGEIGGQLLDCFSTELTVVYEPTFRDQPDWGKAPPEQPVEFKGDLGKFVASIDETVRSMGLGVALTKPRKDVDLDAIVRTSAAGAVPQADILRSLESVVDDWCNVVNR